MVKLFSKNSNLCDHNSPTSQTDRQTDRQTTCDRNTALCTKVHRAVIKLENLYHADFLALTIFLACIGHWVSHCISHFCSTSFPVPAADCRWNNLTGYWLTLRVSCHGICCCRSSLTFIMSTLYRKLSLRFILQSTFSSSVHIMTTPG